MRSSTVQTRKGSLRNKFLLLILPLLFLTYLGFVLLSGWYAYKDLSASLAQRLENIANVKAEVLSKPLWNFDLDYVALSLESLLLDTDIQGAEVLDEHGVLLQPIGTIASQDSLFSIPPGAPRHLVQNLPRPDSCRGTAHLPLYRPHPFHPPGQLGSGSTHVRGPHGHLCWPRDARIQKSHRHPFGPIFHGHPSG